MLKESNKLNIDRLPFSIRILLEGILRNKSKVSDFENTLAYLSNWKPVEMQRKPIPFMPGRVLLQDFTGVPVIVDLAAMRSAMEEIGSDPSVINPVVLWTLLWTIPYRLIISAHQIRSRKMQNSSSREITKDTNS